MRRASVSLGLRSARAHHLWLIDVSGSAATAALEAQRCCAVRIRLAQASLGVCLDTILTGLELFYVTVTVQVATGLLYDFRGKLLCRIQQYSRFLGNSGVPIPGTMSFNVCLCVCVLLFLLSCLVARCIELLERQGEEHCE